MGLRAESPIQKLDALKHGARQGRMPFERDAWLNLAFYLGNQYSEWNVDTNSIQPIARREGEQNGPRPIINKIFHFVRQMHHDAIQDEPFPDVLPGTDDYADIGDAMVARDWCAMQAGETVTDYLGRVSRATLWASIAGTGYLKWAWKPDEKKPIITAPSFFEMYLDPYAREFRDCRYIIQSQFMDVEQVYEAYGMDVSKDAVESADESKSQLLRAMGAAPVLRGCTVNEVWMKPCRREPRGLFGVWTGKTMLAEPDKLPYPHLIEHKMLPYTVIGCVERPDSPYYISPVQFARPVQMELNKAHAQELAIREKFANPKWWIDAQLDLAKPPDDSYAQVLTGSSGGVPGLKPEIIQPAAAPPSGLLDMLEQGGMHLFGQHEVSQGQVPGRVEAAKAIEMLKESDAGAQAMLHKTIRASNSQGWFQLLELARAFQKIDDMVLSYSREGLPEVKHFKAGAMKPGYRVRTSMTTGLARSRTMRQELALRLWDSKAITDPDQLLEMMEVPPNNLLQHRMVAIRLARNENLVIAKGEAVEAHSWDDHVLHLREHNAYRMTHEFETLSNDAKEKFEFHCDAHDRLQEAAIIKQVKLQMLAQGGQPSDPGAAPDTSQPQTTPPPPNESTVQ